MSGLAPGVVVLISILAAAGVLAMCAAVWKLSSGRNQSNSDPESNDAMMTSISNEQANYMRDVRMRGQIQAYGIAPAFEDDYQPPRSQVGRSASVGGMTGTSWG